MREGKGYVYALLLAPSRDGFRNWEVKNCGHSWKMAISGLVGSSPVKNNVNRGAGFAAQW